MTIRFNIIYTGGTVELLLPFVLTLLAHSSASFRLVANGCSAREEARIQQLCCSHDRLDFHSAGSRAILPHGELLEQLRQMETSPYFAIMDSDIFATGQFLDSHIEALDGRAALFSCLPVWHDRRESDMTAGYSVMGGGYVRAANGYLLGLTYYAIYRLKPLNAFINRTGVSFRRTTWRELPEQIRQQLMGCGMQMALYDTAKLLNILMQHEGAAMLYLDTPSLTHLGAVSSGYRNPLFHLKDLALTCLPLPVQIRVKQMRHWREDIPPLAREEAEKMAVISHKRRVTRQYIRRVATGSGSAWLGRLYLQALPPALRVELQALGKQIHSIHHHNLLHDNGRNCSEE